MSSGYLDGSGPLIAFAMVLAGSVGLPIPTLAGLILIGSMAQHGAGDAQRLGAIFGASLAGAALGDTILFGLGRWYGRRMLSLICRLSLSRDACVRQTSDFFSRRGPVLFLIARWVPGLSAVTAPFAGASGISPQRFLGFAVAGAALWIAAGLGLGAVFATQIVSLLQHAGRAGLELGGVIALLMLGYIAFAWTRRRLFARRLRMARIAPYELKALLQQTPPPLIVDERSALQRQADPFQIPGAIGAEHMQQHLTPLPLDTPVVIYCACPNEASAVLSAQQLRKSGYRDVRPLRGGLDGWRNAGLEVEQIWTTEASVAADASLRRVGTMTDPVSQRSGATV